MGDFSTISDGGRGGHAASIATNSDIPYIFLPGIDLSLLFLEKTIFILSCFYLRFFLEKTINFFNEKLKYLLQTMEVIPDHSMVCLYKNIRFSSEKIRTVIN